MANIVSTVPVAGSVGAYRNQWIDVIFDTALDQTTIKQSTVILVKTSDQDIIESAPVYYTALKKIQIRITTILDASTNYTVMIIGGSYGVKELVTGLPFTSTSYQFSFTTGTNTDADMPLAENVDNIAAGWSGTDDIYTAVYEATGEPISHIVTDSTTIGPSGYVGAGVSSDYYLTAAAVDDFVLVSTTPLDNAVDVLTTLSGVVFEFNHDLVSSGWDWTSDSSGVTIEYNDILGYEIFEDDLSFTFYTYGEYLYIDTDLRSSTDYIFTLNSDLASSVTAAGSLGTDYTLNFRTRISPFYSTIKVMRALLGSLIIKISDHEIEKVIYEASLRSIEIAEEGSQGGWDQDNPTTEAKNYVKCAVQLELIMRTFGQHGDVAEKQLGDLTVRYGNNIDRKLKDKITRLIRCIEANTTMIKYGTRVVSPATPVKGLNDERRPGWTRLSKDGDFE